MKKSVINKKAALMMSLMFLLQSCTVYKSRNYSLDDAVQGQTKTELNTTSGHRLLYNYVTKENGNYYGYKKVKGEFIKDEIRPDDIQKVRVKDKTASTVGTVILGAVGFTAVLILIYLVSGGAGI